MKRFNQIGLIILGVLLILLSYKYDNQVNLFFKNMKFPLLDSVLSIITNFGIVIVVMLAVPLLMLYRRENQRKSIDLLLLAFIISVVTAFIIKFVILRQRPLGILYYPFFNIVDYSFPSMHAMVVFSLLPILVEYLPRQKNFWILFAFAVSFTRIYFGFHFLSDVVFGALFGYFLGNYLLYLHQKKKLWLK